MFSIPLMRQFVLTFPFVWALASSLMAADKLWVNEFETAKKTAATEGKDLLINFTGSDWCVFCVELHKEVFDQEAFTKAAPKNFVLVELDYPKDESKLSKELKEQNAKLLTQFGIEGFPSIVLADSSGRPYAQTGYKPGGADFYLKHLEELRAVKTKRDEPWKKAESAQGAEKAKLLAEGLKALDSDLLGQSYKPVTDEIIQLDPADETGVGHVAAFKADLAEVKARLREGAEKRDADAARKDVDAFIGSHPKATPQQKQEALMVLLTMYRPPEDNATVLKLMDEVKTLDPASKIGQNAAGIQEGIRLQEQEGVRKMNEKATEKPVPDETVPAKEEN
jgi:thioredoxin-related protein